MKHAENGFVNEMQKNNNITLIKNLHQFTKNVYIYATFGCSVLLLYIQYVLCVSISVCLIEQVRVTELPPKAVAPIVVTSEIYTGLE